MTVDEMSEDEIKIIVDKSTRQKDSWWKFLDKMTAE